MNNEPVAWIAYDEFGDFMLEATPEGDYPWQPLYTHPAKTLTDEEILNVAFCSEVNTVAIENDWDGTVIEFARAILKKASEK
jgi:hypothetical protein